MRTTLTLSAIAAFIALYAFGLGVPGRVALGLMLLSITAMIELTTGYRAIDPDVVSSWIAEG